MVHNTFTMYLYDISSLFSVFIFLLPCLLFLLPSLLQVIKLCKVLISIENGDRTRLVAQSLDDIPLFRDEGKSVDEAARYTLKLLFDAV